MKLYIAADTGPSGFGVASRGVIEGLAPLENVDISVRSHFWGLNKEGISFDDRKFTDTRFKELIFREGYINDDHLIDDPRDIPDRDIHSFLDDLGSSNNIDSEDLLIRQFDGKEDVWLGIGGVSFAEQAPTDTSIYTILSTDYNLDIIPREWSYYLDKVDEIWVPSEWTKQSILNRIPDIEDSVYALPYGINTNYRPTEYDCEVCPHSVSPERSGGKPDQCLRRDTTTFVVVSRFHHIKGLYRTIKAYIEEFRMDEDTQLFIKTTSNNQFQFNPVESISGIVQETGYPDPPEIGIALQPIETQYMYDLLGHADVFIQCSRAECFGIAQLQAAYCSTPVIYTNWSAQSEVMSEGDGFHPVNKYELERPQQEYRGIPFNMSDDYSDDSKWAKPDIESIQEKMREIHEMDQEELDKQGDRAREHVLDNYRWEDKIDARVERLMEVA